MKKHLKMCLVLFAIGIFISCSSTKTGSQYVKTELFFGLSQSNSDISEKQWKDFKKDFIDKKFSGYTEVECNGFWIDDDNNSLSEKCKMIIYLNKGSKEDSLAIVYVINNYKKVFNQESVLKVETRVYASF